MNGRWLKFSLAVALLGAAGAFVVPRIFSVAAEAASARAGVLVCALSGLVGLALKRWSLEKSGLKAALGATTAMMFVRLALWATGFVLLRKSGTGLAFTAGFFTTFMVVMWLEIGFVFAAVRQRTQGVAA